MRRQSRQSATGAPGPAAEPRTGKALNFGSSMPLERDRPNRRPSFGVMSAQWVTLSCAAARAREGFVRRLGLGLASRQTVSALRVRAGGRPARSIEQREPTTRHHYGGGCGWQTPGSGPARMQRQRSGVGTAIGGGAGGRRYPHFLGGLLLTSSAMERRCAIVLRPGKAGRIG